MRAALMSLGSKSSMMTLAAMEKHFDSVDHIDIRNMEVMLGSKEMSMLYEGKPLNKYDCIYPKGSFRYAPLLRSVTTAFFENTYIPITPNAFTIGHDKLLTHLALQYHKIAMPETYVVSSTTAARKILNQIHYPIIMKFPHGTQGKGVMFAESFAAASSMLDAIETLKNPFLIQEYVETEGSDLRVIVVGDRVAAAMKRKAVFGEKRANIHAGAKGEPVELDIKTQSIAIKTAKAIGAEICAVDILETVKGPSVIEVNLSPGLQGITSVTQIDVAEKIASYLAEKTRAFMERDKTQETSKILADLGVKQTAGNQEQNIIANLDFRGSRILLPEIITKISKFTENHEVIIKAKKGSITVEKG